MSSPQSYAYTDVEVEVAAILAHLSEARGRVPELLRWGARRRRRVGPRASCSPETPLSFPPSGGSSPPPPAQVPAPKDGKKYREWVETQQEKVCLLTQGKSSLLQQIEECKARLQQLQAINSFLKQQKAQLVEKQQEDDMVRVPHETTETAEARTTRRDFDLNEMPAECEETATSKEEEEEEEERAKRMAISAAARRRRRERRRAKAAVKVAVHYNNMPTSEVAMSGAWVAG